MTTSTDPRPAAGLTAADLAAEEPLMDLDRLAVWLGLSTEATQRARREDRLPVEAFKVGRRYVVRRSDLARVLFGE